METNWFDAHSIESLLKLIIVNPDLKINIGPESHNNDLEDLIKKVKNGQLISELPAIEDPSKDEDSCDTNKRWTDEHLDLLRHLHNKRSGKERN